MIRQDFRCKACGTVFAVDCGQAEEEGGRYLTTASRAIGCPLCCCQTLETTQPRLVLSDDEADIFQWNVDEAKNLLKLCEDVETNCARRPTEGQHLWARVKGRVLDVYDDGRQVVYFHRAGELMQVSLAILTGWARIGARLVVEEAGRKR